MNKLKEKRNNLLSKAEQLVNKAKDETRAFTKEERTEYQSTVAEIRALDEQIRTDEELRSLELDNGTSQNNSDSGEDAEVRAFESYIKSACGGKTEIRDTNVNMTYGANGAVIPNTIINKVIDRVINISPLFAAATKYTVKGNITIPYIDRTDGDITVAFAEEFSTLTAKSFKFKSIQLKGYLAACLVLLSKQLINNSQIDVVAYVVDKMAEKLAVFIENFLINVALMAVKRNGRVNLRKYFKVAFKKHDETVTQQEENGINYSMPTLNGTYVKNTTLGMKVARREVDPTTTEGAEIIEKWFTQATYIGETTSGSGSGTGDYNAERPDKAVQRHTYCRQGVSGAVLPQCFIVP